MSEGLPLATFILPKYLEDFSGRIFTYNDIHTIVMYQMGMKRKVIEPFRSGSFINIYIYRAFKKGQFRVKALLGNLRVVSKINGRHGNEELREIVIKYLYDHPELGVTVDKFY